MFGVERIIFWFRCCFRRVMRFDLVFYVYMVCGTSGVFLGFRDGFKSLLIDV